VHGSSLYEPVANGKKALSRGSTLTTGTTSTEKAFPLSLTLSGQKNLKREEQALRVLSVVRKSVSTFLLKMEPTLTERNRVHAIILMMNLSSMKNHVLHTGGASCMQETM
jgi:hypothetical protein